MASRSTVCVCITIPSFPAPLRKTPSLLLKHQFLLMKQPKDGEGGGVPSRSRGRRGPGSPARAGRGGGEGHSHARSPCPPRHSGSGRAGVPGRAGGTRWWRKGPPPGRAKQAGAGGTRSMLGAREGHVPAWRRWETQGCGGTSPVLGGGRGRGGAHPTWPPRPLARPPGLCPLPAAAPGSSALTCGPHSAALPACVTRPWQRLWGLLFSPCGGLGERMEPRWAGWGPGTLAGSGAGGQHGVQGPPLAQPLMSPVRGAG